MIKSLRWKHVRRPCTNATKARERTRSVSICARSARVRSSLQHEPHANVLLLSLCPAAVVYMPRARRQEPDCLHGAECECYKVSTGTEQTLEELDFSRSACAAAQAGDMAKLVRILDKHPDQVHGTGASTAVQPAHGKSEVKCGTVCGHPMSQMPLLCLWQSLFCRAGVLQFVSLQVPVQLCSRKTRRARAGAKGGFTPLHYAARQGRLAMAQLLLDRGVLPPSKHAVTAPLACMPGGSVLGGWHIAVRQLVSSH
jgi:Ankyrin repeat